MPRVAPAAISPACCPLASNPWPGASWPEAGFAGKRSTANSMLLPPWAPRFWSLFGPGWPCWNAWGWLSRPPYPRQACQALAGGRQGRTGPIPGQDCGELGPTGPADRTKPGRRRPRSRPQGPGWPLDEANRRIFSPPTPFLKTGTWRRCVAGGTGWRGATIRIRIPMLTLNPSTEPTSSTWQPWPGGTNGLDRDAFRRKDVLSAGVASGLPHREASGRTRP